MLSDVTEALNSWVLLFKSSHGRLNLFFWKIRLLMLNSACQEDLLVDVGPILNVSQLISLRELELISEFDLLSFFVKREETFGNDCSCVENSCKLCAEQMSLFSIKGWISINLSVQVSSEDVLDKASLLDVLRATVWELNPII